jgi:hypothetical protein
MIKTKKQGFQDESLLFYAYPAYLINSGANTSETMVINFIRMLRDGPDVSLKGSPTVSPTTAAAWVGVPFPP